MSEQLCKCGHPKSDHDDIGGGGSCWHYNNSNQCDCICYKFEPAPEPQSRSVQHRIAAQKGEAAPDFSRPAAPIENQLDTIEHRLWEREQERLVLLYIREIGKVNKAMERKSRIIKKLREQLAAHKVPTVEEIAYEITGYLPFKGSETVVNELATAIRNLWGRNE